MERTWCWDGSVIVFSERPERDPQRPNIANVRSQHVSLSPSRDLLDPEERVHGLGARRAESRGDTRGTTLVVGRRAGGRASSEARAPALGFRWTRLLPPLPAGRPAEPEGRRTALSPGHPAPEKRGCELALDRPRFRQLHPQRWESIASARSISGQLHLARVSFFFKRFFFLLEKTRT